MMYSERGLVMHELVKNCYKKLNTFTFLDEINESSNITESGIYMIRIDNVHSETMVPIYIGRSQNMQKRFKNHLKRLMALNRLGYQEYLNYFFDYQFGYSFYEGQFLYSKIFHTMLANKCSLNDFKMVVIEYCEPEQLEERELYCINDFSSQFLGFNQFHARTLGPQKDERPEFYLQEIWSECQQLPVFLDNNLGYTRFNYYTVYSGKTEYYQQLADKVKNYHLDFSLINQLDKTSCEDYIRLLAKMNNIRNERQVLDHSQSELEEITDDIKEKIRKVIRKHIPRKRIEMWEQYAIAKRFLLNKPIDGLDQETAQLLKEQFSREMSDYRHLKMTAFQLEHISDTLSDQLVSLERERQNLRYRLIFPEKEYAAFPLGHRKRFNPLSVTETPNSLQLHVITNKFAQDNRFIDTYIISVIAIFKDKHHVITEKTYFIDNHLTQAIQNGLVYEEKSVINKPNGLLSRPEPFKPIVKDTPYLTLGIEQLTGLNDSCFLNRPLISLETLFDELETLIDDDTMIAFTSPTGVSVALFLEGFNNTITKRYHELYNRSIAEEGKRHPTKSSEQELRQTLLGNCYLFLRENYNNSKKPLLYNKPKSAKVIKEKIIKTSSPQEKVQQTLENQRKRRERYCNRLKTLTTSITVLTYQDSKTPVTYRCEHCSFEWSSRSDRILAKPVCRNCKR